MANANGINNSIGSFVFDADQAVGAGTDNYVLTYDDVSGEIRLEAAAGGASELNRDVVQTSHGLSVGDVIRSSGLNDEYTKAQADSAENAEVVGIVTAVADVNNFTFAIPSIITTGVPTGAASDVIFLSPTVAGGTTTTKPSTAGQVVKPLGVILDNGNAFLFANWRGNVIGSNNNPVRDKLSWYIPNPTSSEDLGPVFLDEAVTVTAIHSVIQGTTATFTIRHSPDRSAVGNEVVTGGTTTTNTTTGLNTTSFDDATIPANSWVWLETTAATATELSVTLYYTID